MAKKKKEDVSRLLVFEPNPENNEIFSTEDLGIIVELKTTKKSRSVLSLEGGIENTKGDGPINFIGGTKDSNGTHLTTNYTNASVNFNSEDSNRDMETLGIENIQINFDTAYTPKISINFVDIRGNAVFQQGTESKYGVFFDLPYPIFELTVKGFYGKPVTYCLHLLKWNSSFNSNTGNFEIKTEFIGYTYAILTDMLLGFMRAVIKTPEGEPFWRKAVEEYKKADPPIVLKSIDQFIADIQNIAIEFDKIKNEDDNITKINNAKVGEKVLDDIQSRLDYLVQNIIPDYTNYFNIDSKVLGIPYGKNENTVPSIERYKNDVNELLTKKDVGYNEIVSKDLQIDAKLITDIISFSVQAKNCKDEKSLGEYIEKNISDYNNNGKESTHDTLHLAADICSGLPNKLDGDTKIGVHDLRTIHSEIKRVRDLYKRSNAKLTKELGKDLANKAKETLGFDSTIRNVIRILTTHCEVFLKTLQSVSQEAEGSSSRKKVIKEQVLTSGKLSIKKGDEDKEIYPWPEYRKEKASKNGGIEEQESWMGDEINHMDFDKVPELKFVENLYDALLSVARGDDNLINNVEATKDMYYPLSTSDALRINEDIIENPYTIALTGPKSKTIAEEAIRCFFIRAFTFLSINNRAPLYDQNVRYSGEFEAENLYSVLTNGTSIDKDKADEIIGTIQSYKDDSTLIKMFSEGVSNLERPDGKLGKVKMFEKKKLIEQANDEYYVYTYLSTTNNKAILPINGNFDGSIFYNKQHGTLLTNNELMDLSTSNVLFTTSLTRDRMKSGLEDGSKNFRILTKDEYQSHSEVPIFGQTKLQEYLKNDNILGGVSKNYLDQQSLKRATYNKVELDGYNLKNGTYLVPEVNDIVYNGEFDDTAESQHYTKKGDLGEEDKTLSSVLGIYFSTKYRDKSSTFLQPGNFLAKKQFYDEDSNYNIEGVSTIPSGVKPKNWPVRVNSGNSYKTTGISSSDTSGSASYSNSYKNLEIVPNEPKSTYKIYSEDRNTGWQNATNGQRFSRINTRLALGYLNDDVKDQKESDKELIYTPRITFCSQLGNDSRYYSLFGSRWYYEQTTNEARAFLFLHTFSWNGLIGDIGGAGTREFDDVSIFRLRYPPGEDEDFNNEDETPTIKGLFMNNASFLKAPKLWCAFIGSLIYRYEQDKDFIKWYNNEGPNGTYQPFLPGLDSGQEALESAWPEKHEYLYVVDKVSNRQTGISLQVDSKIDGVVYGKIDDTIKHFTKDIKNEFKKIFQAFVKDDFSELRKEFELLYTPNPSDWEFSEWKTLWSNLQSGVKFTNSADYRSDVLTTEHVSNTFNNISTNIKDSVLENYANVGPLRNLKNNYNPLPPNVSPDYRFNTGNPYGFQLLNKFKGPGVERLNGWHKTFLYIQNSKPECFVGDNVGIEQYSKDNYTPIQVKKDVFELYVGAFFKRFKDLSKDWYKERNELEDELEQRVFNSTDDTIIKLNLYRTLSSINAKWVTSDKNMFNPSSCGCNGNDVKIASEERNSEPRLIDSFRFVDRAYNDIGDDFYINPIVISNMIIGKYNSSFFNLLNNILRNNNFTFISLPTFINYNDLKEVGEVFKPYPYKEAIDNKTANGPSFICTYVGQTSTNLNLGAESLYPDDGIVALKDDNNNLIGLPSDFNNSKGSNKDLNIPFFLVSYGRQNQSFFKNVKLDQTEFSETAESLSIIEDLSQGAKDSSPAHIGQNLFNVYQKRAYTCEVEMMGNAMIQPMMYFHLDDIPMFKGAYNIYKVSHTITPHNMTTKFTGTRIKRSKTALIEQSELFGNLLSELITEGGSRKPFGSQSKKKRNAKLSQLNGNDATLPSPLNFIDTPITMKLFPINDALSRDTKADVSDGFKLQKSEVKIFGLREVVELLQKTFKEFNEQAKDKDFNNVVYLNDISFNGGGITSEHASHQIGVDIDLRQITTVKGSKASSITFNPDEGDFFSLNSNAVSTASPKLVSEGGLKLINPEGDDRKSIGQYSREGTRLFIEILKKHSGQGIIGSDGKYLYYDAKINTYPSINSIFFNDTVLINEFSFVKALEGHHNHLHIKFELPERVKIESENSKENSRQFKGTVKR